MHRYLVVALLVGCGGPSATARGTASPVPTSEPVATEAKSIAVGDRAPVFRIPAIDGSAAGVVPGKVNIVFFWATWSEPDKKSIPHLQEIWDKHRAAGVTVLGLSIDDEASGVPEFVHTYGARFPVAWDRGHDVATRYRPNADPTYYVIDRAGIVRFVNPGWHDGDGAVIEGQVAGLLGPR